MTNSLESLNTESIAARSVQGALFTVGASLITMTSGFVRSILLARLLLLDHFGVVALALLFLSLITQVQRFSLGKAFIHRNDDSSANLATFASLHIGLTVIAVILSLVAAPVLARVYHKQPKLASVFAILAVLEILRAFNAVAQTVLAKDLQFRQLAVLNVTASVTMTIVAPTVAWLGGGVWALVVEQVVGVLVKSAGLWLYRLLWWPTFKLDWKLAKWYFCFGVFLFANDSLTFLLDKFDDFWIGTFLGASALGLYSRAYEFARYPRRVLSGPLIQVFFPTFASVKDDRLQLSKAFYRVCSAIIRAGFLVFGSFALVVPEFIRIFLGEKWLPMALTFRLMLLYTLLDPLVSICANLLIAVGQPRSLTKIQPVRLMVFVPVVVFLGKELGVNGVAIAADLMLVLGLGLLFWQARRFVNFSLWRMFLVPLMALGLASATAVGTLILVAPRSDWWSLIVKVIVALTVYSTVSILLERQKYARAIQLGHRLVFSDPPPVLWTGG